MADDVEQLQDIITNCDLANARDKRESSLPQKPSSDEGRPRLSNQAWPMTCTDPACSACSALAHGRTVVHLAAASGAIRCLSYLLELPGLDLSLADAENGWTALHRAVYFGQVAEGLCFTPDSTQLKRLGRLRQRCCY